MIDQNGRVAFTRIEAGARTGPSVAVLHGLRAGHRVVLSGAGFLGDGDLVTVGQPRGAAAAPAARN